MDNEFENLLNKRFKRETSEEENAQIKKFVEENSDKKTQELAHETFVRGVQSYNYRKRLNTIKNLDRSIFDDSLEEEIVKKKGVSKIISFLDSPLKIAASVLLLIGASIFIYYFLDSDNSDEISENLIDSYSNDSIRELDDEEIGLMNSGESSLISVQYYKLENISEINNLSTLETEQYQIKFINSKNREYSFFNNELKIYMKEDEFRNPDFSCLFIYVMDQDQYIIRINGNDYTIRINSKEKF